MPRDAEILGQVANQLSATTISRRKPQQRRLARGLADNAQQRLDERRLPRAVPAQETEDLASLNAQAHFFEGLLPLAAKQAFHVGLR